MTFTAVAVAGDQYTVNGQTYTFVASGATGNNQVNIGAANADRPDEVVSALAENVLGRQPSASTRRVLLEQAAPVREGATAVPDVPKLLALLLGSPEFQRR